MSHYHHYQKPPTRYRSVYTSAASRNHPDGRRMHRQALPPLGRKRSRQSAKFLLASSSISMLALAAILVNPNKSQPLKPEIDICQQRVEAAAVLSRAQLSQLLSVPERSAKEAVRKIVEEPYCVLQPLEIRAGAEAQREAYPLAFDPQTWFVVLYEGEEYAGYDFSFRH